MQDQPSPTGRSIEWQNAGDTYYVNADGEIAALLYHDDGGIGFDGGPEGEMVMATPSWWLVLSGQLDDHEQVDAPPLEAGMDDHEIARVNEAALDAASGIVADHLNRRSS
ncbi:MAG: hypothetical protein AABM42_03050 [Actinomycetota bacterium]